MKKNTLKNESQCANSAVSSAIKEHAKIELQTNTFSSLKNDIKYANTSITLSYKETKELISKLKLFVDSSKCFESEILNSENKKNTKNTSHRTLLESSINFIHSIDCLADKLTSSISTIVCDKREQIIQMVKKSLKKEIDDKKLSSLNLEDEFVEKMCEKYCSVMDLYIRHTNKIEKIANEALKKKNKHLTNKDFYLLKESSYLLISLAKEKNSTLNSFIKNVVSYRSEYNNNLFELKTPFQFEMID